MRERERDSLPSVFVDNLHQHTSKKELFDIFKGKQEIVDIFISRKRRVNTSHIFAFVRTNCEQDVQELCERCNGIMHRGIRIFVKPALFKHPARQQSFQPHHRRKFFTHKKPFPNPIHFQNKGSKILPNTAQPFPLRSFTSNQALRDNRSYKDIIIGKQTNPPIHKHLEEGNPPIIKVPTCEDNLSWLRRSVILSSSITWHTEQLRNWIKGFWDEEVSIRDMGPYKHIVTFMQDKDVKIFLENHEQTIQKSFSEAKPWSSPDRSITRRVWIDIIGIPLHLWNEDNIKEVAGNWGDVVEIHAKTRMKVSFAKARVLIDTNCLDQIRSRFVLQSDTEGFDILVVECAPEPPSLSADSSAKFKIIPPQVQEDEASNSSLGQFKSVESEMNHTNSVEGVVPETVFNEEESQGALIDDDSVRISKKESCGITKKDKRVSMNGLCPNGPDSLRPDLKLCETDQNGLHQNNSNGPPTIGHATGPITHPPESSSNTDHHNITEESNSPLVSPDHSLSISDLSIPPGFENSIPVEVLEKARSKKKKRAISYASHPNLRNPASFKMGFTKPISKNPLSFTLNPKGVISFAKKLGLQTEGREEELQKRVEDLLKTERSNWKGLKATLVKQQKASTDVQP